MLICYKDWFSVTSQITRPKAVSGVLL